MRPTSDRAREALFNILSHGQLAAEGIPFAGAAVLDAFAGTGALGLEALSRGATFAEICDVVAAKAGDQDPVAAMNRMLARWLSDSLLTRG